MKKTVLFTALLATVACVPLVSCSNKTKKIAIGLYTLTGSHHDALDAYLKPIAKANNFKYTFFETGYDASSYMTAVNQQLVSGVSAIITTMDGSADAATACSDAGVYYAGYLCDFENNLQAVQENSYFLGTAVDGRYEGFAWGQHIAERIIAEGKKNIGMVKFPSYAYPHQAEMDSAFREKIAAYNETAADADKITVHDTSEMGFGGFDMQAFITANPGIDAIYAMCGGVDSMYPGMTTEQKASIALYTAGYNVGITKENDFGEGNCIQEMVYCNVESINLPLVRILNKLNGTDFTDAPAKGQRVECSQIIIQNKADLEVVQTKSIYHTINASNALTNVDEFSKLLAVNGGTYAKLVENVQSMDIAALRAR